MAIRRSALLLTTTLLVATSAAYSQPAPIAPAKGMTLDQFVDRQTKRIMAADTDGDGRISRAEMAAMKSKAGDDPARRFDVIDGNHDGYLDQTEIRAALTRRFHRRDSNGDGVLTPDERLAGRSARGQSEPAGRQF